ncbi:MAG: glycosyltransferase, partial [Thermoanaerobaculia bacterium]
VDPRLPASPAQPLFDYLSPLSWHRTAGAIAAAAPAAVLVPWWTSFWGLPVRALFRALARRAPGVARVMLCHNVEDHESGLLQRFLTQGALGAANAFIVHSEANRAVLRRRFPEAAALNVPLPSLASGQAGADRGQARRALSLGPEPLVLFLGLVRRYKGVDVLLEAAPAIAAETGARIAIVGEVFPDMAGIRRQWEESPARERIIWKDEYVSEREMALWLGACDAVVLPYRQISSSAIAARALGAGRPVAAAAVGGLAESIEAGVTGELFAPGDAAGLVAAVRTILARGGAAYEPGLAAASARRSWPRYAEAIFDFVSTLKAGR